MNWIKENTDTVIKIVIIAFTIVAFVLAMDFKVGGIQKTQVEHIDEYKEYRQVTVPNTYMRKDVMDQVIIRLERIERKLDRRNGE